MTMKFVVATLCFAAAVATAPPRLELQLDEALGLTKVSPAIKGAHFKGSAEKASPDGLKHGDVQSVRAYDLTCEIRDYRKPVAACTLPKAVAKDHFDLDLTDKIETTVWKVDDNQLDLGEKRTFVKENMKDNDWQNSLKIDWQLRSTWMIYYDVQDNNGNRAEQVVLQLRLVDHTKPTFDTDADDKLVCYPHKDLPTSNGDIEAADAKGGKFQLCKLQAQDNSKADQPIDISARIKYTIVDPDDVTLAENELYSAALVKKMTTADLYANGRKTVGTYKVRAFVEDSANGYGSGGANNPQEAHFEVKFDDTVAPVITDLFPDQAECKHCVESGEHDCYCMGNAGYYECDNTNAYKPAVAAAHPGYTFNNKNNDEVDMPYDFAYEASFDEPAGIQITDARDDMTGYACGTECLKAAFTSKVNEQQTGDYIVEYKHNDQKGNPTKFVRDVKVGDTMPAEIYLNGPNQQEHYASATNLWVEQKAYCADRCQLSSETDVYAEMEWIQCGASDRDIGDCKSTDHGIDNKSPGVYIRKYTCKDAAGNTPTSVLRTVTVIDKDEPTIVITGDDVMILEARKQGDSVFDTHLYTDESAVCTDFSDTDRTDGSPYTHTLAVVPTVQKHSNGPGMGTLSNAPVTVNNVDLSSPGTYTVTYACEDLHGNKAHKQVRKVVVEDTRCPYIEVQGSQLWTVQAGYKWEDLGAKAWDSLDASLVIEDDGNSADFDTRDQLWSSCEGIRNGVKATFENEKRAKFHKHAELHNGDYQIRVDGVTLKVFCDFSSKTMATTWYQIKAGKEVLAYSADQGECAERGLRMPKWSEVEASLARKTWPQYFRNPSKNEVTTRYFCTTTGSGASGSEAGSTKKLVHAEAGKYVITYSTTDTAGNKNLDIVCRQGSHNGKACKDDASLTNLTPKQRADRGCGNLATEVSRTVLVKDSLPPVISLHLPNKGVLNKEQIKALPNNKAKWAAHNPFLKSEWDEKFDDKYVAPANEFALPIGHSGRRLMAEVPVSSSGAWALAAVGLAAVGAALLADSSARRDGSVPV
eukprot:g4797.t1